MPDFSRGDIVRAPFPYTDRDATQHRPALVVSNGGVGDGGRLCWIVMITSAENRSWPGDVSLDEAFRDCGLPVPSVVRPSKIATVDQTRISHLGRLPDNLMTAVDESIRSLLGLSRP